MSDLSFTFLIADRLTHRVSEREREREREIMKVIIGTELGPVKVFHVEKGTLLGNIDLEGTAGALCWLDEECRMFAAAASHGNVFVCDSETLEKTLVAVAPHRAFRSGKEKQNTRCCFIAPMPGAPDSLVNVYANGTIVLHEHVLVRDDKGKVCPVPHVSAREEPKEQSADSESESSTESSTESSAEPSTAESSTDKRKSKVLVTTKKQVECAAVGHFRGKTYLAMGGKENNVVVYDLATCKVAWRVVAMPPHPQTKLFEPVWPSALLFLPEGTALRIEKSQARCAAEKLKAQQELDQLIIKRLVKNGVPKPGVPTPARDEAARPFVFETQPRSQMLVVATRYGHVRLYDMTAGRQAKTDKEHSTRAINCMTLDTTNPKRVLYGTVTGEILGLDLERQEVTGSFRGVSSSIRMCTSCGNVLVACGLDRFVRVFDLRRRTLITKIHIKLMPTTMLLSGAGYQEEAAKQKEEEDMWQTIAETPFAPVDDKNDDSDDDSDNDADDSDDDDDRGNRRGAARGKKRAGRGKTRGGPSGAKRARRG